MGGASYAMPANASAPAPGAIVTFVVGVVMCYALMQTAFELTITQNTMFFVSPRPGTWSLHHVGPGFESALSNPYR